MDEAPPRRRPGDPVVLRQRFLGRIWSVSTGNVVEDAPDSTAVWLPPGSPGRRPVGDLFDGWSLREHVFSRRGGILRLTRPGDPYSILLFGIGAELEGWYVNLEAPLMRTPIGWDFEDHLLDVWIDLDGGWRWVDEDELAEARERGIFTAADEEAIRAAGEEAVRRVRVGELDAWRSWLPDPAWPPPALPAEFTDS